MKAVEVAATPLRNGKLYPLSVEAYRALGEAGFIPENTELLYGLVYTKMSQSPIHAALVGRLMRALMKVAPPSVWVRSEQPVTCADSEPEPDVSVVKGSEDDYLEAHPSTAELVIEVCVTSHDYDQSKLRAYAIAGVKECWYVLAPEQQVEVYRKAAGGEFLERAIFGPGGEVVGESVSGFRVELGWLFGK